MLIILNLVYKSDIKGGHCILSNPYVRGQKHPRDVGKCKNSITNTYHTSLRQKERNDRENRRDAIKRERIGCIVQCALFTCIRCYFDPFVTSIVTSTPVVTTTSPPPPCYNDPRCYFDTFYRWLSARL